MRCDGQTTPDLRVAAAAAAQALVICPTREIAAQNAAVLTQIGACLSPHPLRCAVCVGGVPLAGDVEKLTRGAHVLVRDTTPSLYVPHSYCSQVHIRLQQVLLDVRD